MKKLFTLFIATGLLFLSCTIEDQWSLKKLQKTAGVLPGNKYWGYWVRMDTGEQLYIDNETVYKRRDDWSKNDWEETDFPIWDYSFDGENIMTDGSVYYFRKSGYRRNFKATISGFTDSVARASMGTSTVTTRRQNPKNPEDTQTVKPKSDGTVEYTGAVPGDDQKITVTKTSDENSGTGKKETTVTVTPGYDGENIGSIPIVENNSYAFKTTYEIGGDEQGFYYGNNYDNYSLKLKFQNIGTRVCNASVYTVTTTDSKLTIKGNKTGNFSSIAPDEYKSLSLTVSYGSITDEYVEVPIKITINDSLSLKSWIDTVTLRFYRGRVKVSFNAISFGGHSTLKGFFIYPDGRSKRFTLSGGYSGYLYIPWSKSDYTLVISGATETSSEIGYSFGFTDKTSLANLSGTWSVNELRAYEPNNSTKESIRVTNLSSPVKSYLFVDDVDFYTINNSTCQLAD